jgi:hypothetical protein
MCMCVCVCVGRGCFQPETDSVAQIHNGETRVRSVSVPCEIFRRNGDGEKKSIERDAGFVCFLFFWKNV